MVGIDLNDYACALARARLVMTAAELAGATSLAEAAIFHPHVYWADGLEQVERDDERQPVQLDLLNPGKEPPARAVLSRPIIRAVLRPLLKPKFQVVVANPPYITERDSARKEYHREKVGRQRRYLSAYREYSLAAPFIERCLQLSVAGGRIGLIVGNSFMKREFGKPLIEKVLALVELQLVVDTSQAFIPHHGTPTVMFFARNHPPLDATVRAVLGKRGESCTPDDPAKGVVWRGIVEGFTLPGFETEFVSVADVPREIFSTYPWSLAGGGVSSVRQLLESRASHRVADLVEMPIGRAARIAMEEVFLTDGTSEAVRRGFALSHLAEHYRGAGIRDWWGAAEELVWFPYAVPNGSRRVDDSEPTWQKDLLVLWPWKTVLANRATFQGVMKDAGLEWYEYMQFTKSLVATDLQLTFANVATHNHFALVRGRHVFNSKAPVVKLPPGATEEDHLALLGFLNSSTACFWMKQVFQPKGTTAANRNHPDPERAAYEFAPTGLATLPVPEFGPQRARLIELARLIDGLVRQRAKTFETAFWEGSLRSATELRVRLEERWRTADQLRQRAVFAQEEIDWLVYFLYGLTGEASISPKGPERLPRGKRAFERVHGHRSFVREGGAMVAPSEAEVETGERELPLEYEPITATRALLVSKDSILSIIENYQYKRHWRDTEENLRESTYRARYDDGQLRIWLAAKVESSLVRLGRPASVAKLTAALQEDLEFLVATEVLIDSPSFDLGSVVSTLIEESAVPNHALHVYSDAGLGKRAAWEETWRLQRLEEGAEYFELIPIPPEYAQGSRGKSKDFVRDEYWRLRGKLDVPKERFIAFTEVPGRGAGEILYGWAGWTPLERVKAILALDEECEDQGIALPDRIALLDSAWRLIPGVIRDDAPTGARLRAELAALVGPEGPSKIMLDNWKRRFPPPGTRGKAKKRAALASNDLDAKDED